MCWYKMNIMSQDEITVMKLNQLLLQMRTDFLSANNSLSRSGYSELLFNGKTKDMIPRRSSFHGKLSDLNKTINTHRRKSSLPIIHSPVEEEELLTHTNVLEKLNDLLGHLETISEPPSPLITNDRTFDCGEALYAKIDRSKKFPRGNRRDQCKNDRANLIIDEDRIHESNIDEYNDEPQYATIDDIQCSQIDERRRCATLGERGPHGRRKDERYVLDDATRYLTKAVFSRHFSTTPKRGYKYSCDMGFIKKFPSDGMINSISQLQEHSTLCRRLKTLEASVGITLKKQLHFFIKKKMKVMNVSGCVYCMYAFYEKHKREADDKAKQIRNTIKEQELLQRQLHEQKQQSDADRAWLEGEAQVSYTDNNEHNNGPDNHRRSWREGLHESGSKSDSEQLGYDLYKEDYARDILEKKLAKKSSPLRRSIPLWGFERTELAREQASSSHKETSVATSSSESSNITATTVDDRSNASTPSVFISPDTETTTVEDSVDGSVKESSDVGLNSEIDKLNCNDEEQNANIDEDSKSDAAQAVVDSKNKSSEAKCPSPTKNSSDAVTDTVYQHTTSVVKSVIELNTGVQHAQPEEFIDLVKVVGLNLRDLLSAVDKEIDQIPSESHKEIEMAHRVLSSDMAELVGKMKIAQKYADTTLDQQNRRNMLQAAHALAIDAKNLFDTFSKLRSTSNNSNTS